MISKAYVQRLIDATPVDYYVSGNDGGRAWWPWRMGKANAIEGTHDDMADTFVLDSNFRDESVTNEVVLTQAAAMDADGAVLADVLHDADATVAALREGLSLARTHDFDGTVVLPIQPPHSETATRIADAVGDLNVWWGVGGVKDESTAVKVDATRQLRTAVGDDAHVHGFGVGVTPELATVVRNDPTLFDSIDNSSAIQNAGYDDLTGTEEKMTVVAARATERRLRNLRMLTPFADPNSNTTQTTTTEWL